jgi:hypothetical protein
MLAKSKKIATGFCEKWHGYKAVTLGYNYLYCKKMLQIFPSPAGMSLTKLSLGNNLIFHDRESGVSDILAREGKIANLFLQCTEANILC